MRFSACALVAAYLGSTAFALGAPPPAEVYGRLPAIQDIAISPDGTKLMIGINAGDIQAVRVLNLADGASLAGARTPEGAKLRWVGWAEEQIATFTLSRSFKRSEVVPVGYVDPNGPLIREIARVGTLVLPGGAMRLMLTDLESSQANSSANLFAPVDGDAGFGRMFAWTKLTADARRGIYRVDLRTGDGKLMSSFGDSTYSVVLDARGDVSARTRAGKKDEEWQVLVREGSGERLLREETLKSGHSPFLRGFLADGRLVRIDYPGDRNRSAMSFVDPSDNKEGVLADDPKYDVRGVIYDPWSHRVVGAQWAAELGFEQRFFEPALEQARALLKTALSSYMRIDSWTRDFKQMIVYAESGDDAGTYYVFDAIGKKLGRLGRTYPELPAANIGKVQSIVYPARDGAKIPGYLTIPPGTEPKNLPTIVLVHGGPWSRDNGDFDFWAQFLASRGYLVLQANYRGSRGFGWAWEKAGFKEWGGLMQRDVEDGAEALASAGYADPARICIVGASYGGYAALAGATLTPNRYACAVSVAGLSDLFLLMQEKLRDDGEGSGELIRIGDPRKDDGILKAASPARHAQDVRAPILLLHGSDDSVVPIEQSKRMLNALKAAQKDVRFVELKGDDHWLSLASTRTQMLTEIEKFLNDKMPATPSERPVAQAKIPLPVETFAGQAILESGGTSHPLLDLFGPLVKSPLQKDWARSQRASSWRERSLKRSGLGLSGN